MKFRATCELEYTLNQAATFLFACRCIPTGGQRILSESLVTTPWCASDDFSLEGGMNRYTRILTYNPGTLGLSYRTDVDISTRIVAADSLAFGSPADFEPQALPFLFPSRYCQSDQMRKEAGDLFGHLGSPQAIATAVCDWIYQNIGYVSGSSGESSSALDTYRQRQGVCRDFAHLAITFCRALNVPARYLACYAHQLEPPDFHACCEVYIGGWWWVFDPTRLAPLNGLIRIATGRDATDAAVCNIFGDPLLTRSEVSCECLEKNFVPFTSESLAAGGQLLALL